MKESEADRVATSEEHRAPTEGAPDKASTADPNEDALYLHPAPVDGARHEASTADEHHFIPAATAGASTHPQVIICHTRRFNPVITIQHSGLYCVTNI